MGTLATLKAGAAALDITPPVGVDLCGYGGRPGPSIGVHDELYAKALYLEAGGRALVITADIIGLDYESVAGVRQQITAATGLTAEQIMIGCSHTHSGPGTPCLPTLGRTDERYFPVLLRKLAAVGELAIKRAADACVGHSREAADVGINRRQSWGTEPSDGTPRGPHIEYVDVLAVNGVDRPIARLFIHPAHGVTLGGDNLLISADWMGYAQRYIERLDPGAVAMFGQGCCGNINSEPRGSFEIAQAQGRSVAGAALKAAELAHYRPDVLVSTARQSFALPCFDPPPVAEAEAILDEMRTNLEKQADANCGTRMYLDGMVSWAQWLLEQSTRGATGLQIPYEAQGIRVGDFALIGLPGEVFVEYAMQISSRSPFQQTAVMSYTNGTPGYIPTAAAYEHGGYEVEGAYRFYCGGYTMIRPESEQLILDAADSVLRHLLGAGT